MSEVKELLGDTQAVLLLCGYFGKAVPGTPKPLSGGEYGRLAKWLVDRQRRPADLLEMSDAEIGKLVEAKLEPSRVRSLLQRGAALALAREKWLRNGLWVLSRSDDAYPMYLRKRLGVGAPPLLYGAGDPHLMSKGGLAIVGSRNVSEAGLAFAQGIAARCGTEGIAVVSGGARGVDAAAMQAAGEAGGIVIGVLADGLLQAVRNRQNRIGIESGQLALASPFYPEAGFNAGNAMARNRYIYALADYCLVVESDLNKGGTWAGATENLREAWVPLFVRPDADVAGNKELIRKGARPFEYDLRERASLRAYLDGGAERAEPKELLSGVEDEKVAAKQETASYEVPAIAPSATSPELDLYGEFLRRLNALLAATSMSQKEIAKSLDLKAVQAKTWLKRAEESGAVSAIGKRKKYARPEPKLI